MEMMCQVLARQGCYATRMQTQIQGIKNRLCKAHVGVGEMVAAVVGASEWAVAVMG